MKNVMKQLIMRSAIRKKILCYGFVVTVLCVALHPDMNGRGTYDFITKNNILRNLQTENLKNSTSSVFPDCDYNDVIFDDTTFSVNLVDSDLVEGHRIRDGGEYFPQGCKPQFSSAIIVPYRDRVDQLRGFLVYMHSYLRLQKIHYRIFLVEQLGLKPFNRAKLLNIGAVSAMQAGYSCLVLHDVDLLPLKPANIYACTKLPRHMSCCVNNFRYVLPYLKLFGGAVAILSKQFQEVNGMSNEYNGWGGEDDDLYSRLEAKELCPCRFEPQTSQYHMMPHLSQQKQTNRKKLLKSGKDRMKTDGLNSLQYTHVETVMHPLFTHIVVEL